MNMAYVRPGGVSQDLPAGMTTKIREVVKNFVRTLKIMQSFLSETQSG